MRVFYHHRTQGTGAEGVHISSFAKGLEELGHTVTVIGPPGVVLDPNRTNPSTSSRLGALLGTIARKTPQALFETMEMAYNLNAYPRLSREVTQHKPTFIYERYAPFCLAGLRVAQKHKIPFVLEMNDTLDMERARQGKALVMKGPARQFEDILIHQASLIVVVSGFLKNSLVQRGVPPERVLVTPNAVHADVFNPDLFDRAAIRQRLDFQDKVVVGFVGAFVKWHRVDFLIEALAQVRVHHPELIGLFVGNGVEREPCEALARQLGIGESVVFTGRIAHSQIPEYVCAMDIGVMPGSNPFGSPMKIFEYMAMGVPAIGPRFIPIEEVIDHEVNGLIFPPDRVGDLAATLQRLVESPTWRKELGAAARQKILTKHLWSHNAENVILQLRRLGHLG